MNSRESQNGNINNIENLPGSSSEYSSDSEDDASSSNSSTDSSSSQEEENLNAQCANTKQLSDSSSQLTNKSPSKEVSGISRAQILENLRTGPIKNHDNKILREIDEDSQRQPADISLAFIGCEDLEQFKQAQQQHLFHSNGTKPTKHVNGNDSVAGSQNIRRKPSSLSQRYGMVRRNSSSGGGVMPMDGAYAQNSNDVMTVAAGSISSRDKMSPHGSNQHDVNLQLKTRNSISSRSPSPKILRPENKVILGDSSDNVSILTDGMLN